MSVKFHTLVVEPHAACRSRLKHAAAAAGCFLTPHFCMSLNDALNALASTMPCDVVFISHRANRRSLSEFLTAAAETSKGADAAFILIEDASRRTSVELAHKVIEGVHGVLYEPYSAADVLEIAGIAARLKYEHLQKREKAAVRVLLAESMLQIEKIALSQLEGRPVEKEVAMLSEICAPLETLKTIPLNLYADIVASAFAEAPEPQSPVQYQPYGGVSKRIQAKIEKKK